MRPVTRQVFLTLSMQAKLHRRLDTLDARFQHAIERIETEEIRAYDNNARFAELEALKKELLTIRFVHKDEL